MGQQREKYLNKLRLKDKKILKAVIDKIALGNFADLDVKKLTIGDNLWRARVGKTRIVFFRDGTQGYPVRIGPRGDIYK